MTAKQQMQNWAEGRIREACPGAHVSRSALQDLVDVHLFLRGKKSQLFGMNSSTDSFADPEALGREATAALRAWFAHYEEKGEAKEHAQVWRALHALGLDAGLPMPPILAKRRAEADAAARAATDAFAGLPSPIDAASRVSPSLASALPDLRERLESSFFERFGAMICAKSCVATDPYLYCADGFDWSPDDWQSLSTARQHPCFLPIAGANGDYIGVFIHASLKDEPLPIVYSSHEENPHVFWVAESLQHLKLMCVAATQEGDPEEYRQRIESQRGALRPSVAPLVADGVEGAAEAPVVPPANRAEIQAETDAVTAFIARIGKEEDAERFLQGVYETSNAYALTHLRAQHIGLRKP